MPATIAPTSMRLVPSTGWSRPGRLETAVRIGVRSAEGPPEIVDRSDLVVDGPSGLLPLLVALAD